LIKENARLIGGLGNRFGELAEHLVAPSIREKFNALGYEFDEISADKVIKYPDGQYVEVDILLENEEFSIAVEIKAKPKELDVDEHIKRLEFLRGYKDKYHDPRKLRGAIAGAIMTDAVRSYAFKAGMYVIEQTGDTVEDRQPGGFYATGVVGRPGPVLPLAARWLVQATAPLRQARAWVLTLHPQIRYKFLLFVFKDKIMYALVEFKGKQYKAEKDALLKVDKVDAEQGASLSIDTVLLVSKDGAPVSVGTPYVSGVTVSATVESHGKDPKIIVFKYKPKKDYRRKQGHRQQYSIIKIGDIAGV
jgi:large subunit ribosomal protein L21